MKWAATVMTLALPLLLATACASIEGATGEGATGEGATGEGEPGESTLPRFSATTLDGGTFALGDHLGKDVVMMSFWATYCEPCKAEMPVLEQLHERYGAQGLQILSVSLDGADTVSGVRTHIKKNGYTFDVVVDDDGTIAQAYNPAGVAPFTVLIGRNGRIAKRIEGFQASEAASLEHEVQALLGLPE